MTAFRNGGSVRPGLSDSGPMLCFTMASTQIRLSPRYEDKLVSAQLNYETNLWN